VLREVFPPCIVDDVISWNVDTGLGVGFGGWWKSVGQDLDVGGGVGLWDGWWDVWGALVGGEAGWEGMVYWGAEVQGVPGFVIRWERGPVAGVVGYLICVLRMLRFCPHTGLAGWTVSLVFP
jgi:hypothetical protein